MTVIDEPLKRLPRLDRRQPAIIDHLTALIPRVLLVAGAKGKKGVDEIAIGVVEPQPPETCEGGLDPFGT